ncbi:hypothetical protein [Streptomyces canus]|uniref:hypothetical protein n=1 Tax=Streptomyces canus TaxID=58343 RepID=UPI000A519C70|nr:hypothetical protein [Streptomyces canus]
MGNEIAFGVGCLAFEAPGAESIDDWKTSVSFALNEIASIRDLEFHEVDRFSLHSKEAKNSYGDTLEGLPVSGSMRFRISIPSRVQQDLVRGRQVGEIEDFSVFTVFDRRHPVSFVVAEGSDYSTRKPSDALVVIREFLRRELGKIKETSVRIRRLGPTPFHAECYIIAGEGGARISNGVAVEVQQRTGYDKFTFLYSPEGGGAADTYGQVVAWMTPEFALFYSVTADRSTRMRRSVETINLADALSHTYSHKGIFAYIRRVLRNKRDLLTLRLAVLQCRLATVHEQRSAESRIENLYSERDVQVVRPYIDKTLGQTYDEEVDTAEKMLEILESQHTQEVQRITTFCASLLGVTVGALLTALLRR